MPIKRYGVLCGRAREKQDADDDSPHYQIRIEAAKVQHRIAVNVRSDGKDAKDRAASEILYLVDTDYRHAICERLTALEDGFHAGERDDGLALDYVRGSLFDTARMRPIPLEAEGPDNDMNDFLDATIARAIDDADARVYAFGQQFEDKKPDDYFDFKPGRGIHDIHMNQGNGKAHAGDDGVWQDGGLLVHFPAADRWVAIFLAFQSQSFKTDAHGHAISDGANKTYTSVPHAKRHRHDRGKHPLAPLGISLSPMEVEPPPTPRAPGETFVSTALPPPSSRLLRAYAFDPSRGRVLGNVMQLSVPYRPLGVGPIELGHASDRLAVVDYDGTLDRFYKPVDLDDPSVALGGGLWPSESDPRFHQQMVYAVARETVEHFETAVGRKLHWRRGRRTPGAARGWQPDDILTLNLYPHAMREPNAFYSPEHHGILFGYFAAGRNTITSIPNQPIFTCLSHDIVVHEMTHAILDGMRGYFIEATNRDVAAFHEGFADLVALFRHFSHREVLDDVLQRTGGRLYEYQLRPDATTDAGAEPVLASQLPKSNPLIDLAQQFGEASGLRHALRSALGTPPTPTDYHKITEPHARGSILVAAVFDAFFSVYVNRTRDLFSIFRAGGGSANPVDLPSSLSRQLCAVANRTAEEFFAMCVRAIDYCPPVDITFGEFLRAMITAEVDRDPEDLDGVRDALMQAFRLRGILPDGARFFSEEALCWTSGADLGLPLIAGLHFGDPNALTADDKAKIAPVLEGYIADPLVRERLGLDRELVVEMPSFHPVFRTYADGSLQRDMVVELVQTRTVALPGGATYPFRAGATLLIEPDRGDHTPAGARVRRAVVKPMVRITHDGRVETGAHVNPEAAARHARQEAFLVARGYDGEAPLGPHQLRIDFAAVHGGYPETHGEEDAHDHHHH